MAVKSDFADIEIIKTQMVNKDETANELKRLLKQKVHVLSAFFAISNFICQSQVKDKIVWFHVTCEFPL